MTAALLKRDQVVRSTAVVVDLSVVRVWNNSAVIAGDLAGEITRLKQQEGGNIPVVGSRTLVHTLMERELVDEYRIMIFPVPLGSGRHLFPETVHKTALRLADTRTFSSGAVVQTYHPVSGRSGMTFIRLPVRTML